MKLRHALGAFTVTTVLSVSSFTAPAQAQDGSFGGFDQLETLWTDPNMPASWYEAPRTASEQGITSFQQSPMLDARVASGELPPVAERLPTNPPVIEPYEKVGTYGGNIVLYGVDLVTDFVQYAGGAFGREGLVRATPDGQGYFPWMAEDVQLLENNTVVQITFRDGLKWSDGTPFIAAEEYDFYYNKTLPAAQLDPTLPSPSLIGVETVDDNTVRLLLGEPFPGFMYQLHTTWAHDILAETIPLGPKHVLQEFLPEFVGEETALERARELGFDSIPPLLSELSIQVREQSDPRFGIVTTEAYVAVSRTENEIIFERNPYYPFVDTEGNQLPYIDEVIVRFAAQVDNIELQAISGSSDVLIGAAQTARIPIYIENEEQGDYRTLIYQDAAFSKPFYIFNMTPPEPAYGEYYQDLRFRQAMSLALNRDQINDRFYFGRGIPMQTTISPGHELFKPEYAAAYAEFDPERAKSLLDEVGLIDQNGDGFRDFPDGSSFNVRMLYAQEPYLSAVELHEYVVTNWAEVGIQTDIQTVNGSVFWERSGSNQYDMKPHILDFSIPFPIGFVYFHTPYEPPEISAFGDYATWLRSEGENGTRPPEEFFDEFSVLYEAAGQWLTTFDDDALRVMLESQAKNLWSIGTVGFTPRPVLVANRIKNVPERVLWDNTIGAELQMRPHQWYIEE